MGSHGQGEMSLPTTVVAIVNGMIGGSILVLPLVALDGGWAITLVVILITGFFSFYCCYLAMLHIGDQGDLDQALLRHFNGSKFLKVFYDFCVFIALLLLLMLYFDLIVIQWQGLVPPYSFTYVNAAVNAALLVIWCLVLKYFQFGAHLMGYGIVSIVGYLLFLIWVVATRPSGPNTMTDVGTGVAGFASMMGSAFSIQGFFIPVLKNYSDSRRHIYILFIAYCIGIACYYYIAYMGAFGIVNRTMLASSQTIESFFSTSDWQVKLLEGIYLVHLYSVFPEYMMVCKRRFFSMFGLKQSGKKQINIPEAICIVSVTAICLIISVFEFSIDIIIEINGAVLGFCFIYLLPSLLHIKCAYFSKGKRMLKGAKQHDFLNEDTDSSVRNSQIREGDEKTEPSQIERGDRWLQGIYNVQPLELEMRAYPVAIPQVSERPEQEYSYSQRKTRPARASRKIQKQIDQPPKEVIVTNLAQPFNPPVPCQQQQEQEVDYSYYYCGYVLPSRNKQILTMGFLAFMFLFGVFIMINGLIQVVDQIRS